MPEALIILQVVPLGGRARGDSTVAPVKQAFSDRV